MGSPIRDLRKSDNLLVQEIGGEVVILNLDTEFYFALEGVALRAWQLMDEFTSFPQILDQLEIEYDVSREQLHADMEAFIVTLTEKGLLQADSDQG